MFFVCTSAFLKTNFKSMITIIFWCFTVFTIIHFCMGGNEKPYAERREIKKKEKYSREKCAHIT